MFWVSSRQNDISMNGVCCLCDCISSCYSTVEFEEALRRGEKMGVVYFQITDKVRDYIG